jgi:acyl CoA:acetate/3-ketoacid CoA transferase beta subunit
MRFGEEDKRMYLSEYFEGTTPEQIAAETGFFLDISRAKKAEPPSDDVLYVLSHQVDPSGLMTR